MRQFQDQVALVTGGGTGIGKAAALAFASRGARVVIGNRNEERGADVVQQINDAGGEAVFRRTDVRDAGEVEALVGLPVERFGRLDIAFNNAGIEGDLHPIHELSETNLQLLLDINVMGVWRCMKHEIDRMLAQEPRPGGSRGVIVNCASIAGLVGTPGLGQYCASKHAVMGLTKAAALELAESGIRVNAVCPAVIETPMADRLAATLERTQEDKNALHPMNRTGTPEEVADLVCFLCSNESSFITGQGIAIDGGYTAK